MSIAYTLDDVSVHLGQKDVLARVTAGFEAGRVHVVRGASGAGKTTLLRLLMGLVEPTAGRVMRPCGARLAAAFQEDRLCEGLTVSANVRMPQGALRGRGLDAFLAREREALGAVGMEGFEGRRVCELSGGERRRVSLLRAGLANVDVLFFDEPLRGLDAGTAESTLGWLVPRLAEKTVFWVTHDGKEAAALPDPLLWTVGGGGVAPGGM